MVNVSIYAVTRMAITYPSDASMTASICVNMFYIIKDKDHSAFSDNFIDTGDFHFRNVAVTSNIPKTIFDKR